MGEARGRVGLYLSGGGGGALELRAHRVGVGEARGRVGLYLSGGGGGALELRAHRRMQHA
jgi:hypothetical protein